MMSKFNIPNLILTEVNMIREQIDKMLDVLPESELNVGFA